jgi:hypothetical protein
VKVAEGNVLKERSKMKQSSVEKKKVVHSEAAMTHAIEESM